MAICFNLWPFGICCLWCYIFTVLVCLDQEKSGNPEGGELNDALLRV
jgi:hypothetical protein